MTISRVIFAHKDRSPADWSGEQGKTLIGCKTRQNQWLTIVIERTTVSSKISVARGVSMTKCREFALTVPRWIVIAQRIGELCALTEFDAPDAGDIGRRSPSRRSPVLPCYQAVG
jgi:hypothetical protein